MKQLPSLEGLRELEAVAGETAQALPEVVRDMGDREFSETHPDGDLPLTYRWTQTGGPAVTFTPNLSVTTFTAPGDPATLTFTLAVTDSLGLPHPTPDEVVVTTVAGYRIFLPLVLRQSP